MTPDRPERKNPRLRGWDYGAGGTYFVTICTKDQRHTLSSLAVGGDAHIAPQNRLTPLGLLAERYLSSIPGVIKSVVMPNHVHFLVTLEGDFLRIWTYIDNNPLRWELDRYYTER